MAAVIFGRKKRPALSRAQVRSAKPIRNPALEFSSEDGIVTLHVPLAARGGLFKLLKRVPECPRSDVELEELGSFVWRLCDGQHSVAAIADALMRNYRLTKAEAEASLLSYLDTLLRRRFILIDSRAFETKR